jgi:hypothetical protein
MQGSYKTARVARVWDGIDGKRIQAGPAANELVALCGFGFVGSVSPGPNNAVLWALGCGSVPPNGPHVLGAAVGSPCERSPRRPASGRASSRGRVEGGRVGALVVWPLWSRGGNGGCSSGGEPMSPERPYFGPAYDYEIDPAFRPSFLNLERDVPSLPVEPGIVIRPVLGKRLNISFVYFEP